MNIHEYQAKGLFRQYGVKTLNGILALNSNEAANACKELSGKIWVVKAQIHAGGRGKGGGVKYASNLEEAMKHTKDILGMNLVTHQTGPE